MAVLGVIIVSRAIHVGRHDRNVVGTVLATVGLAEFHAGNFGDRIPFIGGFEWPGEELFLRYRLPRKPGIDARRTKKQELTHPGAVSTMDEVRCYHEILVNEMS